MIFTGIIKTTDNKRWSVAFKALCWEDAESIAEDLCVKLDPPQIVAVKNRLETNLMPWKWSHFCAWFYKDEKFVNEDLND